MNTVSVKFFRVRIQDRAPVLVKAENLETALKGVQALLEAEVHEGLMLKRSSYTPKVLGVTQVLEGQLVEV